MTIDTYSVPRNNFLSTVLILIVATNTYSRETEWQNLTTTEYLNERIKCQTTIDKFNWSHRTWPDSNKQPKPIFSDIFSYDEIASKVIINIKMEAALSEIYGFNISPEILQTDLKRMTRNSKDPIRLKQLFQSLDNNANTVAECISRPFLTKAKLYRNYNWNNLYHDKLKARVLSELDTYQSTGLLNNPDSSNRIITYYHNKSNVNLNNTDVIKLDIKDFSNLIKRLKFDPIDEYSSIEHPHNPESKTSNLRELESSFIYEEIVNSDFQSIEVRTIVWKKDNFYDWWENFTKSQKYFHINSISYQFEIPNLKANDNIFKKPNTTANMGALIQDEWATNIPTARYLHTAVWTGSEMIIWGGFNGSHLNTGSRYNPTTDTWIDISSISAPSERSRHTAIWTGTEMVLWGGHDFNDTYNTGAKYNPNSDSWTTTSMTNAPIKRSYHTAIWTGNELIIWGGRKNMSEYFNSGGKYNPVLDSWTATSLSLAPVSRIKHTSIWTGDEMIIWGGRGIYETHLGTGSKYNPIDDSWDEITTVDSPSGGSGHTATWTGTEMIIWGSLPMSGRYNPIIDTWSSMSQLDAPDSGSYRTIIWTGSEMIIWGGIINGATNTGSRYSPITDTWSSTTLFEAPQQRFQHTAIWTGSEMIIWGGNNSGGLNSGGRYNPATDSWALTNETHGFTLGNRIAHTAVWTGSEMIVWGGQINTEVNTGGLYSPTTDNWDTTTIINAPQPRHSQTAIWTGSEMIIWGGKRRTSISVYFNTGGKIQPNT